MQIKTSLRYYLTLLRMTNIKKYTNDKCLTRCKEKATLLQCQWGWKLAQPLWGTVWRFFLKLRLRATTWSNNCTPGHTSRGNHHLKGCIHPNVHCSNTHNNQDMKPTEMSIHRGLDKEDVVILYAVEYYSAIKRTK